MRTDWLAQSFAMMHTELVNLRLQVSSWVHLIESFAESCSLYDEILMPDVDPDKESFRSHNFEVRPC